MKTRFVVGMLGLMIGCLALVPVAIAHHSTSYYAVEAKVVQGTVVEYRWRNPHVFVIWDVKEESGKVTRWAGELSSVTTLMGDGLTKNSLKPGDEIIFTLRPSKAGSPQGAIQSMKRPDGTFVLRWSTQGETGLSREEVAKARIAAGLPAEGPGRTAPER
jgi:hypothetical protein